MDASKEDCKDLKAFASFITGAVLKEKNLLPFAPILEQIISFKSSLTE